LSGLEKDKVKKRITSHTDKIEKNDVLKKRMKEKIITTLCGTWKAAVGDSVRPRWTFYRDGTVISTFGIKQGTWAIETTSIRMTWNDQCWETLNLPLDVAHTTGDSWIGKGAVTAVKLNN
jgi:hypothetical protein